MTNHSDSDWFDFDIEIPEIPEIPDISVTRTERPNAVISVTRTERPNTEMSTFTMLSSSSINWDTGKWMQELAQSSAAKPVQRASYEYDLFVCYSRADSQFVDRLESDLKKRNLICWVDRSALKGGESWVRVVEKTIQACPSFVSVFSPDALASEWVIREWQYACAIKKKIIPVICRPIGTRLMTASTQTIDFSQDYDRGLAKLVAVCEDVS